MHKNNLFIIETERLYLKELSFDNTGDLYTLFSDSEIVKFTEDTIVNSKEETRFIIEKIQKHYKEHGFGKWAVYDKVNNGFLGLCGLKRYEAYNKTALSYSFLKQHWGKGYATEASKGVLAYSLNILKTEKIVAWSTPDNIASVRVLEKVGFNFVRTEKWDETIWNYYKIELNSSN